MAPGARSKFGAPMFEPEVFRKQMYCTEVLVTLLELCGPPAVIRHPGNCAPLPPVVTPLVTARSDETQQIMVHSSTQRLTGTFGFRGAKFSILPNFRATVRKTNRKVLRGDDSA